VVLINPPRSYHQLKLCLTEIRAGRERVCGGLPRYIGGRGMSPSSAYLLYTLSDDNSSGGFD